MKQAYHHGDLHVALVEAGLRLLAERTADDLSLREVARTVGVSATAVYRHFPDKGALMAALAQEGLKRLAIAQRAASEASGGGPAGFGATGRAYVRFALANPALFRLIFSSPKRPDASAAPAAPNATARPSPASPESPDAMTLLLTNAAAAAPSGSAPEVTRAIALQAWSLAHGLAMLMLDGQVPPVDGLIDEVINPGGPGL